MNSRKFKAIGILIITVFTAAILFHGFYFIKNYKEAYYNFTQDVTLAFDTALKNYFDELSKSDVIVITDIQEGNKKKVKTDSSELSHAITRDFFQRFSESPFSEKGSQILEKKVKELDGLNITQIVIEGDFKEEEVFLDKKNDIVMMAGRKAADSVFSLKSISNKLVISVSRDTLDFELLSNYFNDELRENNLDITYGIQHLKKDSVIGSYNEDLVKAMPLLYTADEDLLPPSEKVNLAYENASLAILQEGFINSSFSLAFFLLIIFVLGFLYKTIKNQKDLAEIKNDLINNITHEFKTPLATISTSVEALQNFNPENDPEKTKKYLHIGQQQVNKMNAMVEKLLETATLDSEKLMIKKEAIQVSTFCQELIERYQNHNTDKKIICDFADSRHILEADKFHLENALSNLIDNALKYGGNEIQFTYQFKENHHCFSVMDNGGNLSKSQSKKVFDKFYRIPHGNIHNVKGFGIGLYYSKKVIEKHDGKLELHISKNLTHFEACLP
ncbi:sensor histidine kinase [Marivirga arenosa]|uniref:histidine kinase n=1 Tax=Marivirga arenosa TaxID=3059076 RepID=A0AA49GH64_9BACT|nr:HAMP domain-containing sensor histidine kinase [Marivirga sp. BKB1-2]WKK82144.2 HAMP domain-containing sensor histidine kinase [Marivirga sp. BKB1-2]